MELDARLTRSGEEPWGFRMIGGVDFSMPLTVVKVLPNSPAERAGLHNGDTVSQIDGADAATMTHEDSRTAVAKAKDVITLGVIRGLYDPVLDDTEPLFEPIDQQDFDQQSQPTEVQDYLELPLNLPEFTDFKPLPDLLGSEEPRSLTASPFIPQTKPYRPFSTEPLPEIPPLEDPIILNPNYQDEFGRLKDEMEFLPGTRFKLPISEQYDPDGAKQKVKVQKDDKIVTEVKETHVQKLDKSEMKVDFEMKEQTVTKNELKFLEEINKEIDIENIELTATSVVDESIEKAVIVAEEIKKEMEVALSEETSISDVSKSKSVTESLTTMESTESTVKFEATEASVMKTEESTKQMTELVELLDKTTEEIIKQNEYTEKQSQIELKESTVDKQTEKQIKSSIKTTDKIKSESKSKSTVKTEDIQQKENIHSIFDQTDVKQRATRTQEESVTGESRTNTKYSTKNLLSEQRSYTIGLQTIPNIRGTVHSSYHYDLLLRTFFIHLTDVMVALSRFILAEPVLSKPEESKIKTTTQKQETVTTVADETVIKNKEKKAEREYIATAAKEKVSEAHEAQKKKESVVKVEQEEKKEQKVEEKALVRATEERVTQQRYESELVDSEESRIQDLIEKRALSGSRMAQLTEKRPEELMQKMEAVITEFESKSGGEDIEVIRERRSRSRSRIEEPISMSRVDKSSQELSEFCSTTAISSRASETTSRTESMHQKDFKTTESIDGKNMYVAIVEAHVYTNKDAIFDERVRLSEASTDTKEAVVAKEGVQSVTADKVAVKTIAISKKDTEAIVEKLQDTAKTELKQKVEKPKELVAKIKQAKVDDVLVENKTSEKKQEVHIQEIFEPVIEIRETETKQEYQVTEVEEKVESKTEICGIEEVIDVEQETVKVETSADIKKEALPKETVAITESIATAEEKNAKADISVIKEEKKAVKEDISIAKLATQVDVKETIVKDEIVSIESVKQEKKEQSVTAIEEKIALKEETFEKESLKQTTSTKQSVATEEVSIKEVVEEKTAFKEEIQATETKAVEESIAVKDTEIKEAVAEKIALTEELFEKQAIKEVTFKQAIPKEELSVKKTKTDESAQIKISTEQLREQTKTVVQHDQEIDVSLKVETAQYESKSTEPIESINQESTFVAKSIDSKETKLSLLTDLTPKKADVNEVNNVETPSPIYVPPTPLTDEYIFKLEIALPKREGAPIPRDCTPSDDDEDPHIVKKGLIPSIDAEVAEQTIFDPPLPTPPLSPKTPTSPRSPTSPTKPRYVKPGLRGGADREYTKEEILEIERKSSLLASAIDETIKSIEEYKEEVGIKKENGEVSSDNGVMYNGYAKVVETKIYDKTFEKSNAIEEKTTEKQTISENIEVKTEKVEIQDISNVVDKTTNGFIESSAKDTNFANFETQTIELPVENTASIVAQSAEAKVVETKEKRVQIEEEKRDPMEGYKTVHFDPEELLNAQREKRVNIQVPQLTASQERELYKTESGELIGTNQGIVDGLEEAVVDTDIGKEMGKPGITDQKIAELISGEAEMLREAHVMGLSRVIASHMNRPDDSSVDFKKIKPIVESLKDSEVLKALNDEFMKTQEEKKKEERKWTTFLQKPKRPVPRGKGYEEEEKLEPYKVKIVKQPKPKVAPDYKPKDFNTGLLPWEERALREPTPPPIPPEDPILIPEEAPEILEAVDPLPESEVPDLEDSGIPLPPSPKPEEEIPPPEAAETPEPLEELDLEAVVEETEKIVADNLAEEMDRGNIADQIMMGVQNMVDPNAPLDTQLAQMRAQLAALAQLPGVIQQSLELVTRQLTQLTQMEVTQSQNVQEESQTEITEVVQEPEVTQNGPELTEQLEPVTNQAANTQLIEETPVQPTLTPEEVERMKKEEEDMLEEQRRMEKQKKELMEQARLEHESRQIKQRPTPRVGKPKPVFGPATPMERPLVLPGGRKWRTPKDAFNDQFIAETLQAQAEIIAGKAKGLSYESVLLPYDERINFMKYEKPPVSLDHLKDSDVYKMIHNMEQCPLKRVDMLTPVIAEADYREKCRSMTPCPARLGQQVQP